MLKVNGYVHPNDRLDLTNSPIVLIWMDHKFTDTEIKQRLKSMALGITKRHQKGRIMSCHEWLAAGKPVSRQI
jgi:hypothetical protein